ncbi:hypothetical protein HWC08_gp063 [Lactobacillus phage 521B]|uniref:Uncharacterized protein n=1 Tax=Lactobacillus phage 521B TaxID=2510942 RepID=A0A4Y5FEE7_9CAUD|nr:hypothetical protein HWC08_gp063 [Lactobacillus phage 521B]QBJ03413.1 hypothetical protein B521_0063 [Lactobacillus phage 521B]
MKVREVAPQDILYQFKYDFNTDSYVLGEAVTVSKVTSKYIYLDDDSSTKLLRKGKFPLKDKVGRDAWIAVVIGIKWDMYSPDKNWNIGYNKQVKEENEVGSEISPQLDRIKNLFYSLSLEDKKTVLEKLKDIN